MLIWISTAACSNGKNNVKKMNKNKQNNTIQRNSNMLPLKHIRTHWGRNKEGKRNSLFSCVVCGGENYCYFSCIWRTFILDCYNVVLVCVITLYLDVFSGFDRKIQGEGSTLHRVSHTVLRHILVHDHSLHCFRLATSFSPSWIWFCVVWALKKKEVVHVKQKKVKRIEE